MRKHEEQDIQTKVISYLHSICFLPIKYNAIGYYAKSGIPDIICCSNTGRFVAIEMKKPGEKPRPLQKAYLDSINAINGVAFYATSLEEVKQNLKERGLI